MWRVVFVVTSCVRRGVADTSRPGSKGLGMLAERLGSSSGAGDEPWSCPVVMRTCDGSGSVECIVLVKLRCVRDRNCDGMSSRGWLAPVLVGIDVATRIIINDCRLIAPCASVLLMCYQCDMKGMKGVIEHRGGHRGTN
jgi:hypothetical protein